MISVNNLAYYIGSRPIYEDASLHIKPRDKIALAGLNGSGKTTLLKLIAGDYQPSSGDIQKGNDTTIGFLNQDLLSYESDEPILKVALQAFEDTLLLEDEINGIIKQLESDYNEELVHKLTHLQERFEAEEGYVLESRAEEVLEGIGFSTNDLERPLHEFSGGWRMRVMLAKLLLEKPALLMLDEPTNHLDLPSIEWVENYLTNYPGALIVVSHDRTFLRNVATKVVEVTNQNLEVYNGDMDFYEKEKELRAEIQNNAYENQQQYIKQTERFIDRFRAKASKARQVQSRIKALERMDRVEEVTEDTKAINFHFKVSRQSGKEVINLRHITKAYGENLIFDNTNAAVYRGDKIALIGANGKGKSTLLRIIGGNESHKGTRTEGYNVTPAFYAQHQLDALNVNHEILEELKLAGSGKTELELRTLLGCFLFNDEDVFKKIKVLSGGEKSRVALAKTLISEANFLILDEPTNHLDNISENILIQALRQYQGSYVLVSHNRYFLAQVANKIWYIENKKIKEYPGTFKEYVQWRSNFEEKAKDQKRSDNGRKKSQKQKANRRPDNKLKKLRTSLEKLENDITILESKKQELEEHMADPVVYSDVYKLQTANNEYEQVSERLNSLNKDWAKLVEQIDHTGSNQ